MSDSNQDLLSALAALMEQGAQGTQGQATAAPPEPEAEQPKAEEPETEEIGDEKHPEETQSFTPALRIERPVGSAILLAEAEDR